jgi:hypothetical protein
MYVFYLLAPIDPTKLPLYDAIYTHLYTSSDAEQAEHKVTSRKMRKKG